MSEKKDPQKIIGEMLLRLEAQLPDALAMAGANFSLQRWDMPSLQGMIGYPRGYYEKEDHLMDYIMTEFPAKCNAAGIHTIDFEIPVQCLFTLAALDRFKARQGFNSPEEKLEWNAMAATVRTACNDVLGIAMEKLGKSKPAREELLDYFAKELSEKVAIYMAMLPVKDKRFGRAGERG